jgi:hypothetical protein
VITYSDSIKAICAAMVKVALEIENPKRVARNPHFNSTYADLAEVIGRIRSLAAENDLTIVQAPGMNGDFVTVDTMIMHSSGEWLSFISQTPTPKRDPQGVGSAITYLRRYSLAAAFGLAQEDDDANQASATHSPPASRPQSRPGPSQEQEAVRPSWNPPAKDPVIGDDFLETMVGMGKHKFATWSDVVRSAPGYVSWAIDNVNRLTEEQKGILAAALSERGYNHD